MNARARHLIVLELRDLEARLTHQRIDGAIEVTAAAQSLLQAVEAVLLVRDGRIGTQAVLEEVEGATRPQHATHLAERARDIGNRAQRERAQGGVDGRVVEWELRTVEADELHVDRRRVDARLREPARDERRIDCVHASHFGWIERDIEPRAESDLDDVAGQRVDGAAPKLHDLARPEQLVGDAGHHLVRPELHGGEPTVPRPGGAGDGQAGPVKSSTSRSVAASAHCSSTRRGGATDRVVEHERPRVGQAEARRHRRRDRRELRGGDDHARSAGLLQFDGVVHAVGGAAPAVGGAGDHDVGLGEDLLEDVGRARDRRVRRASLGTLLRHQLQARPGAGRQRLRRARHHQRRVGLAVVEHRDAQSRERRG